MRLECLFERMPWRSRVLLVVAIGVFGASLMMRPAPYVAGLRESAEVAARVAPPETNVAFLKSLICMRNTRLCRPAICAILPLFMP
jgi:hypothetical protein